MKNNRFIMLVGSVHEEYPEIPAAVLEDVDMIFYDRQEKREVARVSQDYAQALCLEHKDHGFPFTNLETWFNSLSNKCLESEGLIPTRPEYDAETEHSDEVAQIRELLRTAKGLIPEDANDACIAWHEKLKEFGL